MNSKDAFCITENYTRTNEFNSARKKLKFNFIQNEHRFMQSDLSDLEKTLKINKEIINSLVKDNNSKGPIVKLNEENLLLQNTIKTLKKQRDDYHAKYLMSNQLLYDTKMKADEDIREYKEKNIDLVEELNRKEYSLQNLQRKCYKLGPMLKTYKIKNKEINELLHELGAKTLGGNKISNVIEENKILLKELNKARSKIRELETKIKAMSKVIINL